jgi:hypothetical protein
MQFEASTDKRSQTLSKQINWALCFMTVMQLCGRHREKNYSPRLALAKSKTIFEK